MKRGGALCQDIKRPPSAGGSKLPIAPFEDQDTVAKDKQHRYRTGSKVYGIKLREKARAPDC